MDWYCRNVGEGGKNTTGGRSVPDRQNKAGSTSNAWQRFLSLSVWDIPTPLSSIPNIATIPILPTSERRIGRQFLGGRNEDRGGIGEPTADGDGRHDGQENRHDYQPELEPEIRE